MLKIDRDVYIMNVLKQVEERHFLRHLATIVPLHLDINRVKAFVLENRINEQKRKRLESELNNYKISLSLLEELLD